MKQSLLSAITSFFRCPKSPDRIWKEACAVWRASRSVQFGFTGPRPRLSRGAAALLKVISLPCAEEQLINRLRDSDPRIVSYALAGLELLNSAALDNLPEDLFLRKEIVVVHTFGFVFEISLKNFAEGVKIRRNENQSLGQWSGFCKNVTPESLLNLLAKLAQPNRNLTATLRS